MPASIELSPIFDPTLERFGFPLDHPYIERVYCSVLGPSAVLLLRGARELCAEHPGGARVDLVDLSRSLGLGVRPDADDIGRNAPLQRTMDRLVRFRMAAWRGDDRLGIHPKLPALERHRATRLPEPVQADQTPAPHLPPRRPRSPRRGAGARARRRRPDRPRGAPH